MHLWQEQLHQLQNEIAQLRQLVMMYTQCQPAEVWLDSADIKQQFNFSDSKLYRLRKGNAIPHTKIGGRYHYPKSYFNTILMDRVKGGK